MRDFLEELRDHWDDGYWWADRQLLLAVLVCVATGLLELALTYLKARITRAAVTA